MRQFAPALFAAMLLTTPVMAQDFLQGFEAFVEDMLPSRATEQGAPANAAPVPGAQRPLEAGAAPPLPRPRPEAAEQPQPAPAVEEDSPPPPERVYQTACPALISGVVAGEMLEPIAEGQCGLRSPLLLTAVRINGREIGLSEPVTTNCQMAGALADWLGDVDAYARAALESPIVALNTGTSFMCRNRNGAEDGFVSEHGFGNAVDVTGFTLENGEAIAVDADWLPAMAPTGKLLRQAHGAACGRFTTVLGPEANEEHEDHFHFDLGCHGQSCTAQICE
jgi:hypothetical protein